MSLKESLEQRSQSQCELCKSSDNLEVYEIPPTSTGSLDDTILACEVCRTQMDNPDSIDPNHWRCLNESMWSEISGVQVLSWRMLQRLKGEGWPQELLDMMYLDDELMEWAKATGEGQETEEKLKYIDANGAELQEGDTVTIIKDLPVKGGGFTAKRGTAVRSIHLDPDNHEHIEGRVNNQMIVILTKYVKK